MYSEFRLIYLISPENIHVKYIKLKWTYLKMYIVCAPDACFPILNPYILKYFLILSFSKTVLSFSSQPNLSFHHHPFSVEPAALTFSSPCHHR